jgi:hypothetical protein
VNDAGWRANVQSYQRYLETARTGNRVSACCRRRRVTGGAEPIHFLLETCFQRAPVARSKKIGIVYALQFHTRKV